MKKVFLAVNDLVTIQNFRLELIQEIKNRGFDVTIICPATSDFMDSRTIKYFIDSNNITLEHIAFDRLGLNPVGMIYYLYNFYKILKKHNPEHLLLYTPKVVIFGSFAGHLAGIKNIASTITGLGYVFASNSLKAKILRIFLKPLYALSLFLNNNIFFQNKDDRNYFQQNGIVIESRASLIGGSGVNLQKFYPQPKPGGDFTFLMVARVIPEKGVFDYIEAAKIVRNSFPQCRIQLLGPLEKKSPIITNDMMKAWVENGLIEYIKPQSDVRPYLRRADVFVLPSYREGTPKSALEAMAMAKPIIVTDVPGCREVIENDVNGIIVPPRDPEALSLAMIKFLNDKIFLYSAGEKSLIKAVNNFDVVKINTFFLDKINII